MNPVAVAEPATLELHASLHAGRALPTEGAARPGWRSLATQDLMFLTWVGRERGSVRDLAEEAYEDILGALEASGAVVLQERIFGRAGASHCVLQAREQVWQRREGLPAPPPTFIEGVPLGSEELAGIHVIAARGQGGAGRVIVREGQVCGRVVRTSGGELFALSDVGRLLGSRELGSDAETREVLRLAERILAEQGWTLGDVGRTWFYLRDILDWYGAFNRVRNDEFRRMGLLGGPLKGLIPASTGIEGRNARGGWCTLDLLAARPAVEGVPVQMQRLSNVRQSEATEYGSAFARGVSLTMGGARYVFVSGTASIDDHGTSVHPDDFESQTRRTLDTVEALLAGAGATLADVVQATAFVKDHRDQRAFERLSEDSGLASVPPVSMLADVCRDELLFELDATAVVPLGPDDAAQPHVPVP
jgi:enamine deaminase RidA (YjgF/YER057c/UK114 family)